MPVAVREHPASERGVPVILLAALICSAIFVLDASSPLGFGVGFLYVVVVLLGLGAEDPRFVPTASGVCAVLVVLGVLLSRPAPIVPVWVVLVNRTIALGVVVATGVAVYRRNVAEAREHAIIQELSDLKLALDQATLVSRTDARGVIEDVNEPFLAVSGYAREELIGRTHRVLSSGYHPPEFFRELWATIESGRPWRGEIRNRARDGRIFWLDTTILPMAAGERDRPVRYLGLQTDVTDRKLAEEQRERLAAIIESSDDAILGETIDGIVTTWNAGAERVYGYRTDEVLGRRVDFLLPEDRPNEIRGILGRIAQGERIDHFETVRRCKDGRRITVSLTVSPVKDDTGRIVGASAIARDITERVRSEEALREQAALARLGGMAAVVAHEVKNPLAGIGGALHIIRDRMPAEGADRAVIGEILARLDALNLLVEDLLLFARPRPPRFAPVAIRQLLERTAGHLKRDKAFQEIGVSIEGEDSGLSADPQLLESAFLNLFLNGAQAMGRRGSLEVSLATSGGCCIVEVRDAGPGIPPDVMPRIFEPFFTTRNRGTGLGLPVVRRVVEAHGGQIEVHCPPGGGTVARVSLPRGERSPRS